MRFTTLVAVLLLTGFILFLAGWFRPHSQPAVALPTAPVTVSLEEAASIQVAAPRLQAATPSALPPVTAAATPDAQAVEDRIAELQTLALNDDPNSLQLILVALSDTNPEIRGSALEATIQFGSPDAIPTLQSVLAKTALAEEKLKIQEAIEFLKLPPLVVTQSQQP